MLGSKVGHREGKSSKMSHLVVSARTLSTLVPRTTDNAWSMPSRTPVRDSSDSTWLSLELRTRFLRRKAAAGATRGSWAADRRRRWVG